MVTQTVETKQSRWSRLMVLVTRRARPSATPRVSYRTLFRNRDYALLFSGLAISMTGSWAYNVALVVFVFEMTHSAAWVAAASMTRFLVALVASPFAGVLADRVERIRLMVRLDMLSLVFQVLLAVLAALHGSVVLAVLLVALTSITTRAYEPAARAATPTVVGEDHLGLANSAHTMIDNLSILVGPAIGALLALVGSPAAVFAVNAATFGVSAGLVSRMHARSRPRDITLGGIVGPFQQMSDGFKAFVGSPTVFALASFSILASFIYGTDTVLFVVVSKNLLGTGSTGYGYLMAALGVGGVVMAFFMNRVAAHPRLGAIKVAGMAMYCLPTALLVVVHLPVVAALFQVVRGAGTIIVDVLAITSMQRLVNPDVLARVFGIFFAFVLAAISLGALLMPIMLGAIGLNATLLVMGLAIPAITLLAYPLTGKLHERAAATSAIIAPRVELLQSLDIFAGATRGALEGLARVAVPQRVEAGTVLIDEGAEADDFFVLTAGEVQVSAKGEAGVEHYLGTLQPPAYFGEIGLLERRPRTATVKALTECELYRINGDEFLQALTAASPSPAALGAVQTRLARTHPSVTMTFGQKSAAG